MERGEGEPLLLSQARKHHEFVSTNNGYTTTMECQKYTVYKYTMARNSSISLYTWMFG